ncbi:MAG: efflux RND transporter periplasmic adaptor subunit [Bacteroidales bacterium]|nr:efflux RND transporter periplasmic adaptor subunit [Bacteroidales bacterium]
MRIKQIITAVSYIMLTAINCSRNENTVIPFAGGPDEILSISLTEKQIKNLNIETVKLEKQIVDRDIPCTGSVSIPVSNCARVTAPFGGIVTALHIKNNTYVKSGRLLAVITHPDYLKIQQDYLEIKSLLHFYHEEFTRQGELAVENASSVRKMQEAEVNFRTTEIAFFALDQQLKILGINADSLNIENLSPSVSIRAPIAGYITETGIIPGSHISPETVICEIVNPKDLYLDLRVPEQYASAVNPGQPVSFTSPGDTFVRTGGCIELTGTRIDPVKKTLDAIVFMQQPGSLPMPGTTVYATIQADPDSAYMIPSKAILSTGYAEYVFIFHDGVITRIPIATGTVRNEMTELGNLNPAFYNAGFVINEILVLNSLFKEE